MKIRDHCVKQQNSNSVRQIQQVFSRAEPFICLNSCTCRKVESTPRDKRFKWTREEGGRTETWDMKTKVGGTCLREEGEGGAVGRGRERKKAHYIRHSDILHAVCGYTKPTGNRRRLESGAHPGKRRGCSVQNNGSAQDHIDSDRRTDGMVS